MQLEECVVKMWEMGKAGYDLLSDQEKSALENDADYQSIKHLKDAKDIAREDIMFILTKLVKDHKKIFTPISAGQVFAFSCQQLDLGYLAAFNYLDVQIAAMTVEVQKSKCCEKAKQSTTTPTENE